MSLLYRKAVTPAVPVGHNLTVYTPFPHRPCGIIPQDIPHIPHFFPSSFHPNRRQFAKYQHFKKQSRFLAQILFFCYQRKLNNIVLTVKTYNYEKVICCSSIGNGIRNISSIRRQLYGGLCDRNYDK